MTEPEAPAAKSKQYGLQDLIRERTGAVWRGPEETVLVWPHLVYREFLALLLATVVLVALSLVSGAPLEEMASHDTTPNPMKAPWYFLGLQELLVFFDPWLAGVVLPVLMVVGLMAIPYLDTNPLGKGVYSFSERRLAVTTYAFGLGLWFILIIVGVWFRGLDWQWYWPWDNWEVHKPASSVRLVDLDVMLQGLLKFSPAPLFSIPWLGLAPTLAMLITWALVAGYYVVGFTLPMLCCRDFFRRLGFVRYHLVMFFYLTMMAVPLKIFIRLVFNIKYVAITPWFKL